MTATQNTMKEEIKQTRKTPCLVEIVEEGLMIVRREDDDFLLCYVTPETERFSEIYLAFPCALRDIERTPLTKLLHEDSHLKLPLSVFVNCYSHFGEFCGVPENYFAEGTIDVRPLLPQVVDKRYAQCRVINGIKVYFPTEKFMKELCYDKEEEYDYSMIRLYAVKQRRRRF